MNIDFDFGRDFKEVKEVTIREEYEGEVEEVVVKVCITKHAYDRMYNTFGRQCEWEDVEDLILEKGSAIFDVKNREEFALVNASRTLALICRLYLYKGEVVLVLKTVIRKVTLDNGIEVEKKIRVTRNTKEL